MAAAVSGTRVLGIPHEYLYRGTFAVTAVACTALSYYSLPGFAGSCFGVFLSHVVLFNTCVRRAAFSSFTFQQWTYIASLVASCIAVACVLRSVPSLVDGFKDLRDFELASAMFNLMIFPLVAGYGIPIAQKLYDRGLELLQMAQFAPMNFYQDRPEEYKNLVSLFLDKCAFACGIILPECLEGLPFKRIEVMTIPFCSKKLQEERYHHLLELCEIYPAEQARLLWETALNYLFIQTHRWELLPDVVYQAQRMSSDMRAAFGESQVFPVVMIRRIQAQQEDIDRTYREKVEAFRERLAALQAQVDENNPASYSQIDTGAAALLKEIEQEYKRIRIFKPDLQVPELLEYLGQLRTGPLSRSLQTIRSRINAALGYDRNQETSDYFLSDPERAAPFAGYLRLLKLFEIPAPSLEDLSLTQEPLNAHLKETGIESVGEFVEKILNNDAARLANRREALDALEIYLKDDRRILYRKLGGSVEEKAHLFAFLVARVAYFGVMILAAFAPLMTYPSEAIIGFVCSLPYYASPSIQDIIAFTMMRPEVRSIAMLIKVATRRPFLSLFRGGHSGLKHTYDHSSVLGKLRILGAELGYGTLLMGGTGGFAAGASLGREVWGYFWPQNLYRQHFI